MSIAFKAMQFARKVHADQKRKYTGNPYTDHLAEVSGIVAATFAGGLGPGFETVVAVAWLHDCMEDQNVTVGQLLAEFGPFVAGGVEWLSDLETGSRAECKAASRQRLAAAPGWVQTIKCADLISNTSNTSSIVMHDPKFAVTYLAEKRALLEVLTKADPRLHAMASELATKEAT